MIDESSTSRPGLERVLDHLIDRYVADESGRLVEDCRGGDPPRFVFGRSAEGCIWRFRAGLSNELVIAVARLAGRERGWSEFEGAFPPPPDRLVMMARMLGSQQTPASSEREVITRGKILVGEIWLFE